MTDSNVPKNIYELVTETFNEYRKLSETESYANCLINVIKKYHFYPCMQVKKFRNNNSLVLLHNTYKRTDVNDFKELYEQCRSVVLDFENIYNNVVVSYANNIPDRITIEDYNNIISETDKYQEAYDGTMITVYNYGDEWHFGTTSCPDANSSRFSHPTKKHGNMLDEILMTYYTQHFSQEELTLSDNNTISKKLRELFTSNLDSNIAYEFVVIHYDNKHIIDYTNDLGMNYKVLIHINSKNRLSLLEEDISGQPLSNIGVIYPKHFIDINEACNHITNANSYGLIIKKVNMEGIMKLYKISPNYVSIKEETDSCNPNVWFNLLNVYMKNRIDYHINDYINQYNPVINLPIDNNGKTIDPTYLIHTSICTIRDVLYNLYIATTTYNPKKNMFKMNKELDSQFPPIIRFHLAQLRYKQTTTYTRYIINPHNIYHYLCQCNNVKNIKILIHLFSTTVGYNIHERSALCLTVLDTLLS